MRKMVTIQLLALSFLFHSSTDRSSADLLTRVSENYRNLRSFEFTGSLTATIPSATLRIEVQTVSAEAGAEFIPEPTPVLKYREAQSFRAVKITDADGNDVTERTSDLRVRMPMHWGAFQRINVGVKSTRELPSEVLRVDDAPVECTVVEVVYQRERKDPEELTVKYWIDAKRLMVLKEEFAESQENAGRSVLWRWVYKVELIKVNQPPPDWLVEASTTNRNRPRPAWVGRDAPDFTLPTLERDQVSLSAMRGKIVVLDFWASWCGPCKEELPTVQRIADEYKARGIVVWGISDEKPLALQDWLARNHQKLQTLIDADRTISERYEVEGIPALIVVGRDGRILSYFTGTQSEESLRSAIEIGLGTKQSNNK
jgi:peroxiredoxin